MSKFGLPVHFGVKVIPIDFQLEKYIPFMGKDVSIFFLAVLTSQ